MSLLACVCVKETDGEKSEYGWIHSLVLVCDYVRI